MPLISLQVTQNAADFKYSFVYINYLINIRIFNKARGIRRQNAMGGYHKHFVRPSFLEDVGHFDKSINIINHVILKNTEWYFL